MKAFSLFLAGFEIRVRMDRCSSWPEMERRFRPFLSAAPRAGRATLARHRWAVRESLRAVPNEDRKGRVILPTLAARGRTLIVHHPNYRGKFDLASRQGRAQVAPTFPAFSSLLRGFLAAALPLESRLILHAAGVMRKGSGGAVVFAGASGSGKTTTARHFLEKSPRYLVLSDELLAVGTSPHPKAFGTPFWGDLRHSINPTKARNNRVAPIRRLVFLEKSSSNRCRPLSRVEAARLLMKCTLLHTQSSAVIRAALAGAHQLASHCDSENLSWSSISYLKSASARLAGG